MQRDCKEKGKKVRVNRKKRKHSVETETKLATTKRLIQQMCSDIV